jgi:hypothetical protein
MADIHFSQPTRLFIFAGHAESAANTAHVVNSDPSRPTTLTTRGKHKHGPSASSSATIHRVV